MENKGLFKTLIDHKFTGPIMITVAASIVISIFTVGSGVLVPQHPHPDTAATIERLASVVQRSKVDSQTRRFQQEKRLSALEKNHIELKIRMDENEKARNKTLQKIEKDLDILLKMFVEFIQSQ